MNLATLPEGHPADATALIDRLGSCTYGELTGDARSWRAHLSGTGVGRGDRVALVVSPDRRFVAAYLGVLGIGAVAVPLNPQSPEPELESEIAAVSPRLAIVPDDAHLTIDLVTYEEIGGQSANGAPVPIVDAAPSDPAVLLFTSGTAGFPKAAILTHGSLRANLLQIQSHPGRQALPSDVGLGALPLFHVFGLNVVLNLSLLVGGTLVLPERPDQSLDAIQRHGVTLVAAVPVLFDAWARSGVESGAMSSVRMAISGAAPLSAEVAGSFEERFGIPLWQGYGLTEASPVVTSPVFEGRPVAGSVGVPLPGVEVRLVESSGVDALVGDPGELWVRGRNVFAGYFGDPEATARVIDEDRWLHTGDVAVSDSGGRLFLVERAKDLIIVSGFNVYPQEVERVISAVDGVAEVAVAGISAPQGESVAAYVVRESDAKLGEGDVAGACRAQLAAYKCPSEIFFVDSLPRAATGEVLRRLLRPDLVA